MDCPDPFPWASLFGVVGTLLGAVLGGWLGHWFASRQAADQRDYQDRTRFHDDRLRIYSRFCRNSDSMISTLRPVCDGSSKRDDPKVKKAITEAVDELSDVSATMELIASAVVRDRGVDLWTHLMGIALGKIDANDQTLVKARELRNKAHKAIRDEFHIDVTANG